MLLIESMRFTSLEYGDVFYVKKEVKSIHNTTSNNYLRRIIIVPL